MNSLMSDCYLASNESSRHGTPTMDLERTKDDFEASDEELGDDEEAQEVSTTTETPVSTPADLEEETTSKNCPPQLNPTALMAALQHAASFQQPKLESTCKSQSIQKVPVGNLNEKVRQSPTIMDNFNLDMCFLGDEEQLDLS